MKPALWIILVAALAVAGVWAWVQWRGESIRAADFQAEVARLKADDDAANQTAQSLETEAAQMQAARALGGMRLQAPATPTPPPATPAPAPALQPPSLVTAMLKDPQMHQMLVQQQQVALRQLYSGFLDEVRLTPNESDRFFQLLLDRQMALMNSSADAMSGKGVDMNAATAATNATDDALRQLLGAERFAKYAEFEKTLGARMEVLQFNQQLAGIGQPLTNPQIINLVNIITEESSDVPAIGAGPGGGSISQIDIDLYMHQIQAMNRRVYSRASAFLLPSQLSVFAGFQQNLVNAQIAALKLAGGQ
jgi:hypothetical protein